MEKKILGNTLFHRETISGTHQERAVAEKLVEILGDAGMREVYLHEIPVLSWRERLCYIEAAGTSIACRANPYSLSSTVEAPVIYARYCGSRVALTRPPAGAVVVVPYPDDPDDAKFVYERLVENGAVAVVFYDELPGRYRRIVITGIRGFPYTYGAPPPVPIVSIRKEDYLRMIRDSVARARLVVETNVRHMEKGYVVHGKTRRTCAKSLLVTAHHDHWFTGYSDNLLGLEAMVQVAARLSESSIKELCIEALSFTAEESGAPGYSGWYWMWGSRYYAGFAAETGAAGDIIAVINIDAASTIPLRVASNPMLHPVLHTVSSGRVSEISVDSPYFDSFSFSIHGVPALTIHTLPELTPNYHTTMDDGRDVPPRTLETLVAVGLDIARALLSHGVEPGGLKHYAYTRLGEDLPLEGEEFLHRLSGYIDRYGERFAREATRVFFAPLAQYEINGLFTADYFPETEIAKQIRILRGDHVEGIVLGELIEPGRERVLPHIPRIVPQGMVDETLHAASHALLNVFKHYNRALSMVVDEM